MADDRWSEVEEAIPFDADAVDVMASLQADYERLEADLDACLDTADAEHQEKIARRADYEAMEAALIAHHNIGDQLTVADWGKPCHICAALHRMKGER